jgi:serine-type D-Ala-D-Ala carboxypeptidase/endopeptidase (penicillin-binding protein 4)
VKRVLVPLLLAACGFALLAPVAGAATGPSALRAQLSRDARLAGSFSGAYVYDLSAHRVLFSARADVPRNPASVEKLYTSWAALTDLGPTAQLATTVLGVGTLAPGGTWEGNLYLRGGGDPSLSDAGLATLATELVNAGITHVHGAIVGDESAFDSHRGGPSAGLGFDPDLEGVLSALALDRGTAGTEKGPHAPAAWAAHRLEAALLAFNVTVSAGSTTGVTPTGAGTLAALPSPSLAELLGQMLPPSDNFYAEMLLKGLGARFGTGGTTAAGATVVRHVLAGLGLHPRIVDGSGLSRSDLTTPRQVVTLLGDVAPTADGVVLRSALGVAGRTGTVAHRMRGTTAAGRCQLKTGTLVAVSNLAGYCTTLGGHLIAFAFLTGGVDLNIAHQLQDNMAITLAGYYDGTPPGTLEPPAGGRLPSGAAGSPPAPVPVPVPAAGTSPAAPPNPPGMPIPGAAAAPA